MGQSFRPQSPQSDGQADATFVSRQVAVHSPHCVSALIESLAEVDLAHVMVFASPSVDFAALMRRMADAFACPVVGCTTAGEIGDMGYMEDHILAIGLPRSRFAARTVLIENLARADLGTEIDRLIQERIALSATHPKLEHGFSFLTVDGLSRREDQLVNAIAPSLSGFPLFGGSAGDGLRFKTASVSLNGRVLQDAATLTFVATNCVIKVFSINHMEPTETRMVVTEADPGQRIVKGINAEPAAAEYARLIGKDPGQLDELIFAAHPVTVRIGDTYHVRAIQRVNAEGHLVFFSAIDEGMVLTVAKAQDMAEHLDREVSAIINGHAKPDILGCDCVLRRIEAQKSQTQHQVNRVLRKHGIVGFSTYGEQIGTLHVNHTMTGVAIFPPDQGDPP